MKGKDLTANLKNKTKHIELLRQSGIGMNIIRSASKI